MTTTAHGARRIWGGASLARNVEPGTSPRASMFYELNPHLRKRKAETDITIADRIAPWLRDHGPSTAKEIAKGLGIADASSINEQFRFHRVHDAYVFGLRKTGRRNSKVWALQGIHMGKKDG